MNIFTSAQLSGAVNNPNTGAGMPAPAKDRAGLYALLALSALVLIFIYAPKRRYL